VTPGESRAKRAERAAKIRADEFLCAWDFLVWGDTRGKHADFCVFPDPCSRNYNPWPYIEAEPDPRLYEGTGIGALYGLKGSELYVWQLAGWNLTTQVFDPPALPPTEGKTK
jgi:hypothetical protein